MSGIKDLICSEEDGTLSFGDYALPEKAKRYDFEYDGDQYQIKTYADITKLERNGMFVYESVPGSVVRHFNAQADAVSFEVEVTEDTQITLGMEDETEYRIYLQDEDIGTVKTGIGGKLALSVEPGSTGSVSVKIERMG